jgi:RNA polymerase sigma-70 factor (ECF subfamily)
MKDIWKLYKLALLIIEKICKDKCFYLSIVDIVEECQDYIKTRLESNNFQALKNYDPTRGAKETTYLYTLISSRLIDFFNSAKRKKEIHIESKNSLVISIIDERDNNSLNLDNILEKITSDLKAEEKTLLKLRYTDELSYKEIGEIIGKTHKQVASKIEKILLKLRKKAQKEGLKLEDIL